MSPELGFDTETYGTDFNDRMFAMQIANGTNTYYFNFHDYGTSIPRLERSYIEKLRPIFEERGKLWYIHNAKFDLRRLGIEGIYIKGRVHCTQMCERFINNQYNGYSLDACLKRRGRQKDDAVMEYIREEKCWEWQEQTGKKTRKKKLFFDQVPFDIMFKYGCIDADEVFKLGQEQRAQLKGEKYYENDLHLEQICYLMEEYGIRTNKSYAASGYEYEMAQKNLCIARLEDIAGEKYKTGPKWLANKLDMFGVLYEKNPRTGNPVFDKASLSKINHPIVENIINYRRHEKYATTYYSTYKEQDEIHAFIKTWGTDTGRFSYAEPNLQNVPKEEELSADIPFQVRGCFQPREDHCFVMVDFDQQEFRLLLDYAGEFELIRKINEHGEDVHQATADMVGVTRKMAKTLNFGLLYGMGADKLADALKCSVIEAKEIKRKYFARLPKVRRFINGVINKAKDKGVIKTWVQRKLYFPNKELAYKAPNFLIQGGCGDIMRLAIVDCHQVLKDLRSKILLSVHDELLFEIHKEELDIIPAIVNIMENTYEPFNGMKLTCGVEHSWESWGKRYVKEGKPILQDR